MSATSKKPRGLKAGAAESLFQKWLAMEGWKAHRAAKPAFVKTKSGGFSRSYDVFGAFDFVAYRGDDVWCVQTTTQDGRNARRRKIEALGEMPSTWRVSIISHETTEDAAHRGRRLHFWRIEDASRFMDGEGDPTLTWQAPEAVPFDKAAVEAHAREARAQGARKESAS